MLSGSPVNTNKIYAVFNIKTRQLICLIDEENKQYFPEERFLIKCLEIVGDVFELSKFHYVGDYDSGDFLDLASSKTAVVYEREIDRKYELIFDRKYPSIKEVVLAILDGSEKLTEIREFYKKIQKLKAKNKEHISNSSNHIYVSLEQEMARQNLSFSTEPLESRVDLD